jgi:hypothetical protein
MTPQSENPRFAQLLLLRLLPVGEKGETLTALKKDLSPLVEHRLTPAEIVSLLDRTLASLASEGRISRTIKGKADRSAITDSGRRAALGLLGLDDLPPRTTWSKLKGAHLQALALGLGGAGSDRIKPVSNAPGFKAALMKRRFDLSVGDRATLAQATDALAWQRIGIDSTRKFTAKAVLAALLDREQGGRPVDPNKAVDQILAREVGARKSDVGELRQATLRAWLDSAELAPSPAEPRAASPTPVDQAGEGRLRLFVADEPLPAPDLPRFASRVLEVASACETGRFGPDRVLISHVWHAMRAFPEFASLGLDEFKRRLAEANRARLLDLGRADLVEAMDQGDLRESETRYLDAAFHFVRLPPGENS